VAYEFFCLFFMKIENDVEKRKKYRVTFLGSDDTVNRSKKFLT
jgi:hypothetical protein